MAIEGAIFIYSHIAARSLQEVPDSYADCFLLLGREGVLDRGLAERCAEMAKFRNLILHAYGKIDDRRVFAILNEDLADIERFVAEVLDYAGRVEQQR